MMSPEGPYGRGRGSGRGTGTGRVVLDMGIKAGVESPGIARAAVLDCGLPPARNSQDLALMVSEVVTNAVRHGTGPGGQLRLRVHVIDDVVHVELDEPGVNGWASGSAAPQARRRMR